MISKKIRPKVSVSILHPLLFRVAGSTLQAESAPDKIDITGEHSASGKAHLNDWMAIDTRLLTYDTLFTTEKL